MEYASEELRRSFLIKTLVNINGEILSKENAHISVFDRGFLFGDSIYEVTLTYNKTPFLLEEHLDRLEFSAEKISMAIGFTRTEMKEQIQRTVDKLALDRVYIRLIITRGEGEIGLDPGLAVGNNLVIIVKELPENPTSWYELGVDMIIADVQRNSKKSIDPSVKSGNYLNNILAMTQAKDRGAFDAIMLNYKGQVTEATTSNIWIVKDGKVKTPPLKTGLLSGITRQSLLKLGFERNLELSEGDFDVPELMQADECFLTSTTKGIVPITKVDGLPIGDGLPGPMTRKLHSYYREFISSYR